MQTVQESKAQSDAMSRKKEEREFRKKENAFLLALKDNTHHRSLREWLELLKTVRSLYLPARNCGLCGPTKRQRGRYVETLQVGIRDLFVSRSMSEDDMEAMNFEHQRWFEELEAELNPSGNARAIWKCNKHLVHDLLHALEVTIEVNSHLENPVAVRQRRARLQRDLGHGSRVMLRTCLSDPSKYGT